MVFSVSDVMHSMLCSHYDVGPSVIGRLQLLAKVLISGLCKVDEKNYGCGDGVTDPLGSGQTRCAH